MSNTKKKDESGLPGFLGAALRGTVIGVIFSAALAFILSAVALSLEDPDRYIAPLAYISLGLGALTCGIASRGHGIIAPLMAGGGYVLCLWLASLAFRSGANNSVGLLWTVLGYGGCVIAALLGGTVGSGRKRHPGEGKNSPTAQLRRQMVRR